MLSRRSDTWIHKVLKMFILTLVSAKHKETKQFYTLYNTLDDTKVYLNKEVNLLNSIHDTFEQ